jgi:hypothetical protein
MSQTFLIKPLEKEAFYAIYQYFTLKDSTEINETIQPKVDNVHYVFDNTLPRAPLRKLFYDIILLHMRSEQALPLDDIEKWQEFTESKADVGTEMMRSVAYYISAPAST